MPEVSMPSALAPDAAPTVRAPTARIPAYLLRYYAWAYVWPRSVRLLDRRLLVSAALLGNYGRLKRAALAEIGAGQGVLQAGCVYGDLSAELAQRVGPRGRLEVLDVIPIQVANCRHKLARFPQASVELADATRPGALADGERFDVICCFFLLHELPDADKRQVVDHLLSRLAEGGKAVFIDYHRPLRRHPLRGLVALTFRYLEPFAATLWRRDIRSLATAPDGFVWRKTCYFGRLYQKVVVTRRDRPAAAPPLDT